MPDLICRLCLLSLFLLTASHLPAADAQPQWLVEYAESLREKSPGPQPNDANLDLSGPVDKALSFSLPLNEDTQAMLNARASRGPRKAILELRDLTVVKKDGTTTRVLHQGGEAPFGDVLSEWSGFRAADKKDPARLIFSSTLQLTFRLQGDEAAITGTLVSSGANPHGKLLLTSQTTAKIAWEARVKEAVESINNHFFTTYRDSETQAQLRHILPRTRKLLIAENPAEVLRELPLEKSGLAPEQIEALLKGGDLAACAPLLRGIVQGEAEAARNEFVNADALKRSIQHLAETFPETYPNAEAFLAELERLAAREDAAALSALAALRFKALVAENPLLKGKTLLAVRRRDPGMRWKASWHRDVVANWQGLSSMRNRDKLSQLVRFPVTSAESVESLYQHDKWVGRLDLHFDADKLLFTSVKAAGESAGNWHVYEYDIPQRKAVSVTALMPDDTDSYDACYTATDGRVIFVNSSGFHGVPCVGGRDHVGNLHLIDRASQTVRRLCFDQDNNWHPTLLPNGRVLFTRWEYTDSAHYFSRVLMHMNPDGTDQKEFYGSNSYWPNSLFYAKPTPGSSSKFFGIVTGHHGVKQSGELYLFDVRRGRQEAAGVVQQFPGRDKPVKAPILDGLVNRTQLRWIDPRPLSETYTLAAREGGGIYLLDAFDNIVPIQVSNIWSYYEPILLEPHPRPLEVPDRVRPGMTEAVAFMQDVYRGRGLAGVERGQVKALRVYRYEYSPRNTGGHYVVGMEGGWDVKILLGTVPVEEDGSAMFRIPANTPLAVQPLDENGQALQQMRSWMTAMPGETISCIGCHESQNEAPPVHMAQAARKAPEPLRPFQGEARGFGFMQEVQPILDTYCIGCHDGTYTPKTVAVEDVPAPSTAKAKYGPWYQLAPSPAADLSDTPRPRYKFDPKETDARGEPIWGRARGLKDGTPLNFEPGESCATYFARTITCTEPGKAYWSLGSDDGIVVWLNGKRLLRNPVHRGVAPDQERLTVTLPKGENRLVVEVFNGAGPSGFYFRPVAAPSAPGTPSHPNFADTSLRNMRGGSSYSRSYLALHPYVRRNGPEGDYTGLTPLEFHADTSPLIQMLKKGHHGVKLSPEAMACLVTWIDLNVPYWATWEQGAGRNATTLQRRFDMREKYAGFRGDYETPLRDFEYERTATFIRPEPVTKAEALTVAGFPLKKDDARLGGGEVRTIDLADGVALRLVKVPAGTFAMGSADETPAEQPMAAVTIDKPFWMGETEISLTQYRAFRPEHKNGYYDMHYKDQVKPGYNMDADPTVPAIRVSWDDAMAFCAWLGQKTGRRVTLPTEAQWEWAARAGTATPLFFGEPTADFGRVANLADRNIVKLAVSGVDPRPIRNPDDMWDFVPKAPGVDDGVLHLAPTEQYAPNAFGLKNMIGNVSEWTRSIYKPYPYADADGRNATDVAGARRSVRGGSWRDRPQQATSSWRWRYPQWQKVYNVGFRVVIEE